MYIIKDCLAYSSKLISIILCSYLALSCSNIKKVLIFQETETLKKIPYISEMKLSSSNNFSKESCSYISGKGNPPKIP